jgi:hypothetical protein
MLIRRGSGYLPLAQALLRRPPLLSHIRTRRLLPPGLRPASPLRRHDVCTSFGAHRSDDMVSAFNQELAEISIAGFCNAKLRIAVTRLASTRSQSQVAADVAASLKSFRKRTSTSRARISVSVSCWATVRCAIGRRISGSTRA